MDATRRLQEQHNQIRNQNTQSRQQSLQHHKPNRTQDIPSHRNLHTIRKHKIITDANRLYRQLGIHWERPLSGPVEMPTFLPTEEEINQLIGGLGPKLVAFMMLVKDTYARACEAFKLKWNDLDLNGNSVTIVPEKSSKPRRIKLKNQTIAALLAHPWSIHIPHLYRHCTAIHI